MKKFRIHLDAVITMEVLAKSNSAKDIDDMFTDAFSKLSDIYGVDIEVMDIAATEEIE